MTPAAAVTTESTREHGDGYTTGDIESALDRLGIRWKSKNDKDGRAVYELDQCLTSAAHTDGARLFVTTGGREAGKVGYKCHHNTCAGKTWQDVKGQLFPNGSRPKAIITPNESQLVNTRPATIWKIRTLVDAYAERPPIPYAISGLFAQPSLNAVYGSPGAMKSMVMADGAVCVAAGLPWLHAPDSSGGRAVLQSPVLWVDLDNGQRRSDERFEALARARNLPADTPLFYATMPDPLLDASHPESMAILATHIKQLEARFVVIDNLGLTAGDADENAPSIGRVMANYRRIVESLGVALILIHHQRKGGSSGTRLGELLRGHSSIEASLDLALLIAKEDKGRIYAVGTKERGVEVDPFSAVFSYEHKPGTKDLAIARFWPYHKPDKTLLLRQAILDALVEKGTSTKGNLVKAVRERGEKSAVNKIRDEIANLMTAGAIELGEGKGNSIICQLPEL